MAVSLTSLAFAPPRSRPQLENFTGQVNEIEEEMYQRAAEIEFAFEEAGKSIE